MQNNVLTYCKCVVYLVRLYSWHQHQHHQNTKQMGFTPYYISDQQKEELSILRQSDCQKIAREFNCSDENVRRFIRQERQINEAGAKILARAKELAAEKKVVQKSISKAS